MLYNISNGDRADVVDYINMRRQINPNYKVVDVGGAHGGWSSLAAREELVLGRHQCLVPRGSSSLLAVIPLCCDAPAIPRQDGTLGGGCVAFPGHGSHVLHHLPRAPPPHSGQKRLQELRDGADGAVADAPVRRLHP